MPCAQPNAGCPRWRHWRAAAVRDRTCTGVAHHTICVFNSHTPALARGSRSTWTGARQRPPGTSASPRWSTPLATSPQRCAPLSTALPVVLTRQEERRLPLATARRRCPRLRAAAQPMQPPASLLPQPSPASRAGLHPGAARLRGPAQVAVLQGRGLQAHVQGPHARGEPRMPAPSLAAGVLGRGLSGSATDGVSAGMPVRGRQGAASLFGILVAGAGNGPD